MDRTERIEEILNQLKEDVLCNQKDWAIIPDRIGVYTEAVASLDEWVKCSDRLPSHKDLCYVFDGKTCMPSTYYNNQSFKGFYMFSNFYEHDGRTPSNYTKTKLKEKHKITGVIMYQPLPNKPNKS